MNSADDKGARAVSAGDRPLYVDASQVADVVTILHGLVRESSDEQPPRVLAPGEQHLGVPYRAWRAIAPAQLTREQLQRFVAEHGTG